MSILIKGMNMPKDIAPNVHQKIILVISSNGLVYEANRNRLPAVAVEVPEPHGRLIDADKLIEEQNYTAKDTSVKEMRVACRYCAEVLKDAPTVIEEEEQK